MEKGPVLRTGLRASFGCVAGGRRGENQAGFGDGCTAGLGNWKESFTLDVPAPSNPAAGVGRQFPFPPMPSPHLEQPHPPPEHLREFPDFPFTWLKGWKMLKTHSICVGSQMFGVRIWMQPPGRGPSTLPSQAGSSHHAQNLLQLFTQMNPTQPLGQRH